MKVLFDQGVPVPLRNHSLLTLQLLAFVSIQRCVLWNYEENQKVV